MKCCTSINRTYLHEKNIHRLSIHGMYLNWNEKWIEISKFWHGEATSTDNYFALTAIFESILLLEEWNLNLGDVFRFSNYFEKAECIFRKQWTDSEYTLSGSSTSNLHLTGIWSRLQNLSNFGGKMEYFFQTERM